MKFAKGDRLGEYVVVFPHKKSSYAETYRVKDAQGGICFLKLIDCSKLQPYQIDDKGAVLEIEICKQNTHPNLCSFIDSGYLLVDGRQWAYLVVDYISGETLFDRVMREGELSVYDIKQIAIHLLKALSYLHRQPRPILHGEVSIQNVFVSFLNGWDQLKLIDYGHARYLDQHPNRADLEYLNPNILAPECFAGVLQKQSDLYAVGVLIYQLLYGSLPFGLAEAQREGVERILELKRREVNLPQLSKFELDEQLENCILKAIAYRAEDRFQTAEEFIEALQGNTILERKQLHQKLSPSPEFSVSKPEGEGFAAVAGMEELKKLLREEIIEPLRNPEEYKKYGITIPNGMLLYGPPGCGKTFFAKHFAQEVDFRFLCLTPASLKSKYVNATQENIAKMFKEAEEMAPTIIFIDEINELVPNREHDVHEMSRSAVNEMLAQMDRTGEKGIFIIGATNYPHMIDPAILRAGRLDKKYYVGVPDQEGRKALFEINLRDRPYDFGIDYDELARLTENYVSADIQLIVNEASRKALKAKSKITMELLRSAISETLPSLTQDELERYKTMEKEMNTRQKVGKNNRPIGFR